MDGFPMLPLISLNFQLSLLFTTNATQWRIGDGYANAALARICSLHVSVWKQKLIKMYAYNKMNAEHLGFHGD